MKFLRYRPIFSLLLVSLLLSSCRVHYLYKDGTTETSVIALDSSNKEEDSIAVAIIAPYKASMEAEMEEVIAYSDQALSKAQPEGLLNNFISDLVLKMAGRYYTENKIDFVLLNNGGLRSSLPKGEIKVRNVYELMPFENKISIMIISGNNAAALFDYVAREGGMPVSGITMGIKEDKAVNISVQSQAFDPSRNYIVATNDYLADGGDKMSFFNNPIERIDLPVLIRNAIIEYLKELTTQGVTVNASLDKRIYYEK